MGDLFNHFAVKALTRMCLVIGVPMILGGCYEATMNPFGSSANGACKVVSGQIINAPCDLDAGQFLYENQYGGRSVISAIGLNAIPGTNPVTGDYQLSATLPSGWSDGTQTATMNLPATLNASNIRSGVTLFGILGTFVTTQKPACVLNSVQTADCTVGVGRYHYATAYNGRSATCEINGSTDLTTACFVDNTVTNYLVSIATLPAACSGAGGVVTAAGGCRGAANTFSYATDKGGRGLACATSTGIMPAPCWLTIAASTSVDVVTGGSGSASSCNDDAQNAGVCLTRGNGRYVYTTAYGGRSVACTRDNLGNCFFTQTTKASLEPNLKPENIKAGVKIFGITGSFGGLGVWGSGIQRQPGVATQLLITQESGFYAASGTTPNLPAGNHEVPLVTLSPDDGSTLLDDDGSQVQKVDRSSWGSTSCGTTATTIDAKITDCGTKFGTSAFWDGTQNGNASQGRWKLVQRDTNKKEVWKDINTGMLWSSLVSTGTNWCKASGSSNITALAAALKENDPDGICTSATYQNTTGSAISACFEGTGFTTDSTTNATGKAGLTTASTPKVNWRIPTLYDYEVAEYNGIRFVMPDEGFSRSSSTPLKEWTGTLSSVSDVSEQAWAVDSASGEHTSVNRTSSLGVRCIGR